MISSFHNNGVSYGFIMRKWTSKKERPGGKAPWFSRAFHWDVTINKLGHLLIRCAHSFAHSFSQSLPSPWEGLKSENHDILSHSARVLREKEECSGDRGTMG